MREWVLTGSVGSGDGGSTSTVERDPSEPSILRPAPTIEVGRGVKVSQRELDNFMEMGGSMTRKPRRLRGAAPAEPQPVT